MAWPSLAFDTQQPAQLYQTILQGHRFFEIYHSVRRHFMPNITDPRSVRFVPSSLSLCAKAAQIKHPCQCVSKARRRTQPLLCCAFSIPPFRPPRWCTESNATSNTTARESNGAFIQRESATNCFVFNYERTNVYSLGHFIRLIMINWPYCCHKHFKAYTYGIHIRLLHPSHSTSFHFVASFLGLTKHFETDLYRERSSVSSQIIYVFWVLKRMKETVRGRYAARTFSSANAYENGTLCIIQLWLSFFITIDILLIYIN